MGRFVKFIIQTTKLVDLDIQMVYQLYIYEDLSVGLHPTVETCSGAAIQEVGSGINHIQIPLDPLWKLRPQVENF